MDNNLYGTMIKKHFLKPGLIILLVQSLSGCTATETKIDNNQPAVDLMDIRQKADQAYIDDDFVASEEYYTVLVKEVPEEAEHWFRLANVYVKTDRPYAAMNLYREAVIRDPEFTRAWYNLGIVQLKQTAFSLNEMLIYTDSNDPLHSKAEIMLEKIKAIINE